MAAETSTEYRLGSLNASLRALIAEVRGMRSEMREAMAQHDKRDDERFQSHAARLDTIEKALAIDEHEEELAGVSRERRHAALGFIGPTVAAIVAAVLTWLMTYASMGGMHP